MIVCRDRELSDIGKQIFSGNMLTVLTLLVILTVVFYHNFIRPMKYWRQRSVPQGNPIWLFGEVFYNIIGVENFTITMNRAYKQATNSRFYGIYLFTQPTLLIKDPKLLKQVIIEDFGHFVDHMVFVPEEIDPLWGKNLVELKGIKWKHMRHASSSLFTSSKMRFMFGLMSECAENFVESSIKSNKDRIKLNVKDFMSRYINDVIASTAFGVAVDSLENPNNEFYAKAKVATNINALRVKLAFVSALILPVSLRKLLGLRVFNAEVSNFFRKIVNETVRIRKERGIVRPDLVHILLEAQKNSQNDLITNEDILAQSIVFLTGGHETISTLLSFMCYELALNKHVQEKLRREIMEIKDATDGKLTYDSISQMKYMDMVISESLRKYPVMSVIDRICTKSYIIEPATSDEKPLHIEKGTLLCIPVYSLHRDPKYFMDPDIFDPERFNNGNKHKIEPYAYLPFGLGPRSCIGARFSILNTKIMAFHLLSNFELLPTEETMASMQYRKDTVFIVPERDVLLEMRPLKP